MRVNRSGYFRLLVLWRSRVSVMIPALVGVTGVSAMGDGGWAARRKGRGGDISDWRAWLRMRRSGRRGFQTSPIRMGGIALF